MKRTWLIALLFCPAGLTTAAPHRIEWGAARELTQVPAPDGVILHLARGVTPVGTRWPARVARVEIPADARVARAAIGPERERVLPLPPDVYQSGAPAVDVPFAIHSDNGFEYRILPEGDLSGHRIAHILISPFRVVEGELRYLESFSLDLELDRGPPAPLARRVSHPRTDAADARLLRAALDADPLPTRAGDPGALVSVPPELAPETTEYVIITAEDLAPAFAELATLKTREGQPAKIATVESIFAAYEGIDLAARIRAYLRDLYLYQGLRFALLAGDAGRVPARQAVGRFQFPGGVPITTDLYFGCLDGDWNADGDDELGEGPIPALSIPGDDADLYAEIAVSRVPCASPPEAERFVAKWKSYTGYDAASFRTDYQDRFLALAEVLFPDDWVPTDPPEEITFDGAAIAESTLTFVPPHIQRTKLYQYHENPDIPDARPEVRDSVIAEINRGYAWIDHIGHGFRTNMSVGDGKLINRDADAFSNSGAYSVLYAVNCTSGAFAFDCIVEHLLMNPDGGAIAAVSSTDLDYPSISQNFKYEFFRQVFQHGVTTLGSAFHLANVPFVPVALSDENVFRWTVMTLIAMGDPSLELWREAPRTLDLAFAPTVALGDGSFQVTATEDGSPVEGVTVCLWKTDGYGVGVTDAGGTAFVDFLPRTEGSVIITATKNSFVPAIDSTLVVAATSAALLAGGVAIHDGTAGGGDGNADARADAGESVVLDVSLRNDGTGTATGVEVVLHAESPFVTVSDSVETSPDIGPGDPQLLAGAFALDVGSALPDTLRHVVAPMTLELRSEQGVWFQPWPLSLHQRILDLVDLDWSIAGDDGDGVLEAGEGADIFLTLANVGEGFAPAPLGVGSVAAGSFVMLDDTIEFDDLTSGAESQGGPLSVLSAGGTAGDLRIDLVVSDAHGSALLSRTIDLLAPSAPETIHTSSAGNAITLTWPRPPETDVRGYRIYRADSLAGPFETLTENIAQGGSRYIDEGLSPLTSFYYRVAAVDLSGNEGAGTTAVRAATSPPLLEGWPVVLPSGESKGSPTFSDLDGDDRHEIVLGWRQPMVFRSDGGDFVDGDGDGLTVGIFAFLEDDDSQFWNSPALADLDDDGLDEIVFAAWQTTGYGHLYVLDETGAVEPGWPREIGRQPWSTAAVGDVDGDGDLEIFVSSGDGSEPYRGVLFGFHHDGTEIIDGDGSPSTHGVFHKAASPDARYMYGSPALADFDGDGDDEIVFLEKTSQYTPTRSTLYVFDGDGTVLPGWPYTAPDVPASTSSPAIADLDGDGDLEIVAVVENGVLVMHHDGTFVTGWPRSLPAIPDSPSFRDFVSSPAIGDVDRDGRLDIALGWLNGNVHLWTGATAQTHGGFPADLSDDGSGFAQYMRSPIIGNIDGDPDLEIVLPCGDAKLYAVNSDGTAVAGFPISSEGVTHGSVALWDVDGDGSVNLIVQTDAPILHVYDFFDVAFRIDEHPWPMFRHDARKTGCLRTPITTGVGGPSGSPTGAIASVHPAYPNPSSSSRVTLAFEVPAGGDEVRVRVFDVGGRVVRQLARGRFPEGRYRIEWDGRTSDGTRLAAGVYLARVEIGGRVFVQKLTIVP
jgi:hypothetical protein